jgi:ketosteroid isomerase-like protein
MKGAVQDMSKWRLPITILMLIGLAVPVCSPSNAIAADAKAEILAVERKCLSATTLDDGMKCYDPTDKLILYDADTPRESDGAQAVRAHFAPAYGFKDLKMTMTDEHVVTDGKLALTNGIVHMTGTDKNGKPVDLTWRSTNVWQKEKGGWKIIHEHNSFPVDLVTGKPDLQSKP